MFKTSFAKYLAAFIVIIFVSFAILTGIITSLVRTYAFSDTEKRLSKESTIVVGLIKEGGVGSAEEEVYLVSPVIEPMVNFNPDYDVVITDKNGKILLSTAHSDSSEKKTLTINTTEGLGNIDLSYFKRQTDENGAIYYV